MGFGVTASRLYAKRIVHHAAIFPLRRCYDYYYTLRARRCVCGSARPLVHCCVVYFRRDRINVWRARARGPRGTSDGRSAAPLQLLGERKLCALHNAHIMKITLKKKYCCKHQNMVFINTTFSCFSDNMTVSYIY